MAEQAPMGWYDDPTRPGTQRFWDGSAWTDDHRPSSGRLSTSSDSRTLSSAAVKGQRFDSSFRGYAESEVDAFLHRAANSLQHWEQGRPGGCTSAEVADVKFATTFGGLAEAQVDEFLERVAAALQRYEREPTAAAAKAKDELRVPADGPTKPVTAKEVAEQSFPEERAGYTESKVDDLLRRAAASLEAWESGEAGELTALDAQRTRFFIDIRGYPKQEVDEFVSRIVSTLRRFEEAGAWPGN